MPKAKLFKNKFEFNKDTANIFDNMLKRSVPFYEELQRMIVEITETNLKNKTNVYDIGCSTGITLLNLFKNMRVKNKHINLIGIDYSDAMLEKARKKLYKYNMLKGCELIKSDINENIEIKNASVVILSLTLQFVKPARRKFILSKIFNGLRKNGCLILVEKLSIQDPKINKDFIEYYDRYKMRKSYSASEIDSKKRALVKVLIPHTYFGNIAILQKAGFKKAEEFFRWYNFSGLVAFKD